MNARIKNNKSLVLILLALFIHAASVSQEIGAYHDFRDHFYVFDGGKIEQLEHIPVTDFKIGNDYLVYVDGQNVLKMYQFGKVEELSSYVTQYHISDYLFAYGNNAQLVVYENGKSHQVSVNYSSVRLGDSLAVFYDRHHKQLRAFYNDSIHILEDALVNEPIRSFQVGDNICAFVGNDNFLKVFYHGQLTNLVIIYERPFYKVARNLVAYIDPADNSFNCFYKNNIYHLSDYKPLSYKVHDDKIVFVDYSGYFKIFSDGELYEISSFEPEQYELTEDLVAFLENGYFYVYYNQQVISLENYLPSLYLMDQNIMCYTDINGYLKVFFDGQQQIISYEKAKSLDIYNQVIVYKIGVNTSKIFYRGEIH